MNTSEAELDLIIGEALPEYRGCRFSFDPAMTLMLLEKLRLGGKLIEITCAGWIEKAWTTWVVKLDIPDENCMFCCAADDSGRACIESAALGEAVALAYAKQEGLLK